MAEPFELLATPFSVYLAPEGTDRPDIAEDPADPWELLGTRGPDEYAEDGITVSHAQEITKFRGLRGTAAIKAWRNSEDLRIGFTLHDLSLESYGRILNNAQPTSADGVKTLAFRQGPQVETFALLMRSPDGPYADGAPIQYWVPKVHQAGSPEVVHRKGQPAGLALSFEVLEYLDAETEEERLGVIEAAEEPLGS